MKTPFDGLTGIYDARIAGRGKDWTVQHTVGWIKSTAVLQGHILDMGCGTGLYTRALRALSGESGAVVGMDFSLPMLREAKRSGRDTYVCADGGMDLPFADCVFDFVAAFDMLTYLQDPASILFEAKRVLKPGGVFFCVVPNSKSIVRKTASFYRWGSYTVCGPREKSLFTRKGLVEMLQSAFPHSGSVVIRPVPGFASGVYTEAPSFLKPLFFCERIGLGLLGWGRS